MVRVTMLAVGQGVSNLIEVYDNAGRMENLILIDCGGNGFGRHENVRSSAERILKAMRARAVTFGRYDRYLDVLSVSHPDKDHHSILKKILGELEDKGQTVRIGNFFHFNEGQFHSLRDSYKTFTQKVGTICSKNETFMQGSAYGTLPVQPFYTYKGIELYLVYANARGGNLENSVSAVIEARIRDGVGTKQYRFLFPADATAETMNCIYNLTLPSGEDFFAMSAPHHGSIISCGSVALKNFLDKLPTEEIIISAGEDNTFGHPHLTFTEIAKDKITEEDDMHCYLRNSTDTSGLRRNIGETYARLFTSYWPEGAYGEDGNGYYHYIYIIRQGIMDETFLRATAPRGDIFALSGMKKTRTTTKYWHATAAPGMAERR